MKEAVASLAELPHRCPLAPENKEFPFEVRQLLYGRKPHQYRVLFTIHEDDVFNDRQLRVQVGGPRVTFDRPEQDGGLTRPS